MLSENTQLRCIDDPLDEGFRIVGTDSRAGRAAWMRAWARCARGDVFSHPAYLLDRSESESTPLAAIFDDAGSQVLFAFQLRRITHNACGEPVDFVCYDIATPLLYGGPLLDAGPGADRETVLARFWQRLRRWALAEGVVTEIHRINPVAAATEGYPGALTEQAPHIVKNLDGRSDAELFADSSKGFRRNVRRAEAAGLEIIIDDTGLRLDDFLRLHRETMERNRAGSGFYCEREFFEMLHDSFPGQVSYLYALDDDRPVSVEMIVFCGRIAYALLGASDFRGLATGANSLLSLWAFGYARDRGASDYVLTGGVTNTEDDSLLRYKLSMAKSGRRSYRTAGQVIDEARYAQLSQGHLDERFFPAYRAPESDCTATCRNRRAEVTA